MKGTAGSRLIAVVLLLLAAQTAAASTLLLKNGGRVVGEITNPQEQPRKSYSVKTAAGVLLTIPADQVREVLDPRNALPKYEEFLLKMPESADGNWRMAQWCGEQELQSERQHHLRRVLDYDADHAEARAALGYKRNAAGDWENPDQRWLALGYEKVGSRYKSPQEIELSQERDRYEAARAALSDRIRSLHSKALRSKDQDQALTQIRALEDPIALEIILTNYLTPRPGNVQRSNPPTPELKKVYISVVAKKLTPAAVRTLVHIALADPIENLRDYAAQQLSEAKHPGTTGVLLAQIGEAIKNGDQATVNRAAAVLAKLKAEEAVFPLIAALEMKLRTRVGGGAGGGIGANPVFDGGGNAGLTAGGKETIIERTVYNQGVLAALRELTRQDFEYNQVAWRQWYISRNTPNTASLRRDD